MKLQIKTNGVVLTRADHELLWRRIDALQRRLTSADPDLVTLEVALRRQARRTEVTGNFRLVVMNHVLAARRNQARHLRTLLRAAFDDMEEQLDAMKAGLRHEGAWERKRGRRSMPAVARDTRRIADVRASLDEAIARPADGFDRVAESDLAGARKVIFERLTGSGQPTTTEALDAQLAEALTQASAQIAHKPERWTMQGWLAHVARHGGVARRA